MVTVRQRVQYISTVRIVSKAAISILWEASGVSFWHPHIYPHIKAAISS
jgi:hypothetical protein